jgi:hypothetical protein
MALFDGSMFGGPAGLWPYAGDLPMHSDAPWLPQAAGAAPSELDDILPFWISSLTAGPPLPMPRAQASAPRPRVEAPLPLAPEAPGMLPAAAAMPAGPFDRLINGLGTNGNTLMGAGAALLSGQGFGGALKGAMTGGQLDRQQGSSHRQLRALIQAMLAPRRSGWSTRASQR